MGVAYKVPKEVKSMKTDRSKQVQAVIEYCAFGWAYGPIADFAEECIKTIYPSASVSTFPKHENGIFEIKIALPEEKNLQNVFSKLKGDGEFCEDNAYGCMQKIVKLIEKK